MSDSKMVTIKLDKPERPLTIIACIPGNNFSGTFFRAWSEFTRVCYDKGINLRLSSAEDAVVYYVRNKCLGGDVLRGINQKPFNGSLDYDYMLWIDSDIIFDYAQFEKLLSWNKNIAAGLYLMKGGDNFATVKNWDTEFFKKTGSFQFLTPDEIRDETGLMEVAYTGFGFMLIKKGVFESLEYPWFRPNWQEFSEHVQDFASEDVSFCQNVLKKGYKIFADPTIVVGHEKKIVYSLPK